MFYAIFILSCSVKTEAEADKKIPCEQITESLDRDKCLSEEILELKDPQIMTVITKAKMIEDVMIRGAAVSAWVRDHNNEINQKQGKKLCEILDGRDRFYCMRRLSSPHLKR